MVYQRARSVKESGSLSCGELEGNRVSRLAGSKRLTP
jgi:hypothetical protein